MTSECENVPMELDKLLPNKVLEKEIPFNNATQDIVNQPILNPQDAENCIVRIESDREERNKYLYFQMDEVKHMNRQIKEMNNVLKKDFTEWTSSEKNQFVNPEKLREEIRWEKEEIRREKDRIDREKEEIRREKVRIDG